LQIIMLKKSKPAVSGQAQSQEHETVMPKPQSKQSVTGAGATADNRQVPRQGAGRADSPPAKLKSL